ncbi:hypothetical protein BA766_20160 [Stenotrophomonas maltophilia]|uniref:hypothetical protein n=1 Tax=Stenotrophomonas maltophilia TaxID=40324 RepID=UPI0008103732|nr:hypothetical protein [Stenotrophomonas maltophilia]OCK48344.1 hypothetical protein BA766_20160 [Stenotrophomonas maltophilia]
MSAPVDVLAVMEDSACALEIDARRVQADEVMKARSAVAELMDEARRCCAGTGDLSDLRAALARVKGGAA